MPHRLMSWLLMVFVGGAGAHSADGLPAAASAASAAAKWRGAAAQVLEETHRIPVTVQDLNGRRETVRIPVLVFRPPGDGPFPLVVMNHGRGPAERRALQGVERYDGFSRHMVGRGFAVMLPVRVGYGETHGDFDPESTGPCSAMTLEPQAAAASDQVLAAFAFAQTLPYIDTRRWLVAGQSVGGLASIATVWRHPEGLVGGINFAGGTGGNPRRSPGRPCHPEKIEALWRAKAADAVAPMLWLYWQNDEYWGAENPLRWHAAWVAGGGNAEFHQLLPAGRRGHDAMTFDMAHWAPLADAFLDRLGFPRPHVRRRTRPSRRGRRFHRSSSPHASLPKARRVPTADRSAETPCSARY